MHPNSKLAALGIGCRDMIDIRIAFDPRLARPDALRWAMAAFHAFRGRAVNLDQHRIVNVRRTRLQLPPDRPYGRRW